MRRFQQIGPSRFNLEQGPGGWFVHEVWWKLDRYGNDEEDFEDWFGPFTREGAVERLGELEAERGRVAA